MSTEPQGTFKHLLPWIFIVAGGVLVPDLIGLGVILICVGVGMIVHSLSKG
jgi:uncharacterized membrane protein YczE